MSALIGYITALVISALAIFGIGAQQNQSAQSWQEGQMAEQNQAIILRDTASQAEVLSPSQAVEFVYSLPEIRHPYTNASESSLYCGDRDYTEDASRYFFTCSILVSDGHHVTIGRYSVDKYSGAVSTSGSTSPTPTTDAISVSGMSKYTDSDFGFSFWYPSDWLVSKESVPTTGTDRGWDIYYLKLRDANSREQMVLIIRQTNQGKMFDYPTSKSIESHDAGATMGGLKITSYTLRHGYSGAAVQLNEKFFIYAPWGYSDPVDPTPLLKTMVVTDGSLPTLVSASEQVKVIQAEKAAYTGR